MRPTPWFHAAADFPDGSLVRAAAAGRLVRVAPGCYARAIDPEKPRWEELRRLHLARIHAVASKTPTDTAIGYAHAAVLHGATTHWLPDRVDLVSPRGYHRQDGPRYFRRHRRDLSAEDLVMVDGVLVTSPDRTLLDVARLPDTRFALSFADRFFRDQARMSRFRKADSLARQELVRQRVLAKLDAEPGMRGNRRARTVIERANGLAETPLESQTRRAVLVLGLPTPELQVEVWVENQQYFTDHGWGYTVHGRRVWSHLESDGDIKFGPQMDRDAMNERDSRIRSRGDGLDRISWPFVSELGFIRLGRLLGRSLPAHLLSVLQPVRTLMTPEELRFFDGR